MGCLGEDSKATGGNAYHHFENSNGHRRQHGVARDRTLFLAHGAWTVDGRSSRHIGIISVGWLAAKFVSWGSLSFLHISQRGPSFGPLCARISLHL